MRDSEEHSSFDRRIGRTLAVVVALTLLAYGGAIAGTRIFDDFHSVFENELLRDAGNIPAFFTDRDTFSAMGSSHYRPLVVTSYALTFAVFGDSLPAFHVFNLLVHVACTATLFLLLCQLLEGRALRQRTRAAAIGAALFGIHPAASQVVHYISSRSESMALLGVLAALACHAASLNPRYTSRRRRVLGVISALAVAFALLSKETGIIVLPLLVAVDLALDKGGWNSIPRRAKRLAAAALIVGVYFTVFLLPAVRGGWSQRSIISGSAALQAGEPISTVPAWVDRLRANWTYLELVLFPRSLAMWRELPATDFPYLFAISAGALIGGGLIASGVLLLSRSRRLVGLAIAMTLVPLVPYVVRGLNAVVHEGRIYPPLVGVALAAALTVAGPIERWRSRSERNRRISMIAALALCLIAIGRDWQSSYTWASEVRLWRASLEASPGSGNMHAGLGTALMDEKRFSEATAQFQRALDLGVGQRFAVYDNLGRIAYHQGNKQGALAYFQKAYEDNPNNALVLLDLGILTYELGHPYEGLAYIDGARGRAKSSCEPHIEALRIIKELGRRDLLRDRLQELPRHCSDPVLDDVRSWAKGSPPP